MKIFIAGSCMSMSNKPCKAQFWEQGKVQIGSAIHIRSLQHFARSLSDNKQKSFTYLDIVHKWNSLP